MLFLFKEVLKFASDLIRWAQNTNRFDKSIKRSLGLTFEEFTAILVVSLHAWFLYFMGFSQEKPNIPTMINKKINTFFNLKRELKRVNSTNDIDFEKLYISYEMLRTINLLIKACNSLFKLLYQPNSEKIKRYVVYFWKDHSYLILGHEWEKYKGAYFKPEVVKKQIKDVDDYLYDRFIDINTKSGVSGQFYRRNKPVYLV